MGVVFDLITMGDVWAGARCPVWLVDGVYQANFSHFLLNRELR